MFGGATEPYRGFGGVGREPVLTFLVGHAQGKLSPHEAFSHQVGQIGARQGIEVVALEPLHSWCLVGIEGIGIDEDLAQLRQLQMWVLVEQRASQRRGEHLVAQQALEAGVSDAVGPLSDRGLYQGRECCGVWLGVDLIGGGDAQRALLHHEAQLPAHKARGVVEIVAAVLLSAVGAVQHHQKLAVYDILPVGVVGTRRTRDGYAHLTSRSQGTPGAAGWWPGIAQPW